MNWYKRLYIYRLLKKYAIANHIWLEITGQLPLIKALTASEKAELRVLATLFIHQKKISAVKGLQLTPRMKVVIAAQACLPILNLGLQSYQGWHEIILYPGAFVVDRETHDESGLVSSNRSALSGEAWDRGPVILSWEDVERDSFNLRPGKHVVIHEFSHKLDMLNGRANGMPPLHPNMSLENWTESLSKAYQQLIERVDDQQAVINSYAVTNPAEFFAVFCEYFFTAPDILLHIYPDVFDQLKQYFRQNPLQRIGSY
ncbi:MAG: zinc-dependent peptidase [Gammaproteobacteria bacterium]|nr:zinc-dependent peptidase [Gammaproteobacteria bacterium]